MPVVNTTVLRVDSLVDNLERWSVISSEGYLVVEAKLECLESTPIRAAYSEYEAVKSANVIADFGARSPSDTIKEHMPPYPSFPFRDGKCHRKSSRVICCWNNI